MKNEILPVAFRAAVALQFGIQLERFFDFTSLITELKLVAIIFRLCCSRWAFSINE